MKMDENLVTAYTRDDRGYTGMFIHLLILGMTRDIQVCLYSFKFSAIKWNHLSDVMVFMLASSVTVNFGFNSKFSKTKDLNLCLLLLS